MKQNEKSIGVADWLSRFPEETPRWLAGYRPGCRPSFRDIMSSRTAFSADCGMDGCLVKVGNMSHTVHSFLHADSRVEEDELARDLDRPGCFTGYHSIGRIHWEESDLLPNGRHSTDSSILSRGAAYPEAADRQSFHCITEILERDKDADESHGAERIAVTFLHADAVEAYYQLYCMEYRRAPWLCLLDDSSFALNRNLPGRAGILDNVMGEGNKRPKFVICSSNTRMWRGYEPIPDVSPVFGGAECRKRVLYGKKHAGECSCLKDRSNSFR